MGWRLCQWTRAEPARGGQGGVRGQRQPRSRGSLRGQEADEHVSMGDCSLLTAPLTPRDPAGPRWGALPSPPSSELRVPAACWAWAVRLSASETRASSHRIYVLGGGGGCGRAGGQVVSGTRGLAAWALGTRGSPPALWGSAPSVLSLGRYLYSSHLLLHRLDQTRFEKGENAVSDEPFCAPPPVLTSRLCLGCLTDVGPASPRRPARLPWLALRPGFGPVGPLPQHSLCRLPRLLAEGLAQPGQPASSGGGGGARGRPAGPGSVGCAVGPRLWTWGAGTVRAVPGSEPGRCRDWSSVLAGSCPAGAEGVFQQSLRCRLLPHARGVVLARSWSGSHPRVPDAHVWACAERPAAPLLTKQISPRLLKAESQTKMTMIARSRKKLFHTT